MAWPRIRWGRGFDRTGVIRKPVRFPRLYLMVRRKDGAIPDHERPGGAGRIGRDVAKAMAFANQDGVGFHPATRRYDSRSFNPNHNPTSGRNQGLPLCAGIAGQCSPSSGFVPRRPIARSASTCPISVDICAPCPE